MIITCLVLRYWYRYGTVVLNGGVGGYKVLHDQEGFGPGVIYQNNRLAKLTQDIQKKT